MYQIGEFSRMTSLTVKTLRYYDEAGILVPSCRGEENGYRLYSDADYQKAKLIILLRKFSFSIGEIRDIAEHYENSDDLQYYLAEKKTQMERKIKGYRKLIRMIDDTLLQPEQEEHVMQYEIQVKTFEPALVAAIRFKGSYGETGKYFGKLYSTVKNKAAGAPFNLYYDGEYRENDADIEICVPVKDTVTGADVQTRRLPAMKAIVTTHVGPYEKLGDAYKALTDYAAEHHLKMKTPSRETYLKGPSLLFKGNPNKYETEIAIEIEE